ncbi:CheY-like chemotaxis protein [Salinibacter ruber]|uniref:LytR/AlgR family response regulator transcription factor n=1 Tax=Salinibacter ruber TaxID=146919 RepID=UPI00216700E3|nr:response regulator [Salinibacter ruber]MCS3751083.1 CheY-like chemotaxis protein [Salinibacter ruber]
MPVRCLLVDDEPPARERLRALLGEADADVEIVAEAGGGEEAASLIREHKLDVVFLDVQMPVLDGFDVVDLLPGSGGDRPHVVFVTAYDEHAKEAFEVRALDYLTKPVRLNRLSETLRRMRDTPRSGEGSGNGGRPAFQRASSPRRSAALGSGAPASPESPDGSSAQTGPNPERTVLDDLLYRRVPQVLAGYLGVTWTLFELAQWLAEQYAVPPRLGRMGLFALLLLLPSVLLITYRHGRPGPDRWTRAEQAGLVGNLVVATLILLAVFGDVGLGL